LFKTERNTVFNETKEQDRELIARRCLGTLNEIDRLMQLHGFSANEVVNLDEMGLGTIHK